MSRIKRLRIRLAQWLDPKQEREVVRHHTEVVKDVQKITQIWVRLPPQIIEDIRRKANVSTVVTHQTTAEQASWQLGAQHVMRIIESDFQVKTP